MLNASNIKAHVAIGNDRRRGAFFPCAARGSSLEPYLEAAKCLSAKKAIRLSSAFSSFALSRNVMRHGEWICIAMKSTRRGAPAGDPNRSDNVNRIQMRIGSHPQNLLGSFLRENSGAKTYNPTSMKGRELRQPNE
jgi:hypothetical protein